MRAAEQRIALAAAIALVMAAGVFSYPWLRGLWHHHRLVERLDSPDATQKLRAAIDLAALRDERAVPVLVAALEMGDGISTRSQDEVAALCTIGGTRTIRALEVALHHPVADRSHVTAALACIDDLAARAVLAKSLQSGDADLLRTIVTALSESRDQRIVNLLIDAEKRADRRRRLDILASLSDPTGRALEPRLTNLLTTASKDQDSEIRIAASGSLVWSALNAPASTGSWAVDGQPAGPQDAIDTELATAAKRASAFLAARQDPAGYWRTSRTRTLRFEHAYTEMNTYLTPVMVDMLTPVADVAGLRDNLTRARAQIAGEIEDSGLVRYYGSGAGFLGLDRNCAITFDADDTALAWRVAPRPNPRMLRNALATLRQYRAPNGLYRTWLAPTDRLQCIDRGSDPNPTDVGIQMHILMLLAQAEPAAAQDLCTALTKSITDDRIWTYYQLEPLIPLIRQGDLAKVGCPIEVPEARIRADVAGQGKWLAAGLVLSRLSQTTAGALDRPATIRLLQRLAQGDFLAIRRAPPLLYQNDATGTVPAFYWSQEFGYALWLRLYFETVRRGR